MFRRSSLWLLLCLYLVLSLSVVVAPMQRPFRRRSNVISRQRSASGRYLLKAMKTTTPTLSVASSSVASSVYVYPPVHTVTYATSVSNTVAPYNVQQDASVTENVILGKRRTYDEALSAEEDRTLVNSEGYVPPLETTTAPWSYEDAFSTAYEEPCSKRYKFDHDFSPELAFEIELEAMTRGFAALSIDYSAGASKSQKVVRKATRYRAGGLRGAGGVAFVNGMPYKSPRAYLLCVYTFSLLMYLIIQVLDLLVKLSRMTDTSGAKSVSLRSSRGHLP